LGNAPGTEQIIIVEKFYVLTLGQLKDLLVVSDITQSRSVPAISHPIIVTSQFFGDQVNIIGRAIIGNNDLQVRVILVQYALETSTVKARIVGRQYDAYQRFALRQRHHLRHREFHDQIGAFPILQLTQILISTLTPLTPAYQGQTRQTAKPCQFSLIVDPLVSPLPHGQIQHFRVIGDPGVAMFFPIRLQAVIPVFGYQGIQVGRRQPDCATGHQYTTALPQKSQAVSLGQVLDKVFAINRIDRLSLERQPATHIGLDISTRLHVDIDESGQGMSATANI